MHLKQKEFIFTVENENFTLFMCTRTDTYVEISLVVYLYCVYFTFILGNGCLYLYFDYLDNFIVVHVCCKYRNILFLKPIQCGFIFQDIR